ncbi:hypothetical protein V502_01872 [Pseudogymnoascus sp. VKM F-4520 (FW-2644)]|nr:hypothetical protein V502_01872 [Pseudogymnoascus sp. VKM F-4520 (FW-2644)]
MPADGSRPLEGLPVVDGVRCQICHDFKARTVGEFEHHLYELHSKTEGGLWEHVRMQSWGWQGGVDDEYWVVDESKDGGEKAAGDEKDGGYLDDEGWSDGGGREESEEGQGFDDLQQWVGEEPSTWGLREVDRGGGIEEDWQFTE